MMPEASSQPRFRAGSLAAGLGFLSSSFPDYSLIEMICIQLTPLADGQVAEVEVSEV
jgi:hypothetical protein